MMVNKEKYINTKLKNIWMSGMMGLVVGDALGSPAQFRNRREFENNPITEMEYCKCFNMPAGSWTDDSSLAIATLDAFTHKKGYSLDLIAFNFGLWLYKGKFTPFGSAYDIGYGCESGIRRFWEGQNPKLSGSDNERNNGNGSLMRIMPACLYAYELQKKICTSDNEVIQMIHEISGITHRHLRAQMACGLYFYMAKSILDNIELQRGLSLINCLQKGIDDGLKYYRQDIRNLTEITCFSRLFSLDELKKTSFDDIRSSGYVIDTIEAVVYNLISTETFEDCLVKAINMGGDSDSVGAIAGGLAGLYYGYDSIPERWISKIQRREWIEDMCILANSVLSYS